MLRSPFLLRISNTIREAQILSSNRDKWHKLELNGFSPEGSLACRALAHLLKSLTVQLVCSLVFCRMLLSIAFSTALAPFWGTIDMYYCFSSTGQKWMRMVHVFPDC